MTDDSDDRSWFRRNGWLALAILGGLVGLSGAVILINPVDWASFEDSTGVARNPDLATWVEGQARLCGSMAFGVGAFVIAIAATHVRRQDITGWHTIWIFPGLLALMSVVFALSGAAPQAGFYGGIAILATASTLLAKPTTQG